MRANTAQVACAGKTSHSYEDARRIARAMRHQDKGRVQPYHCAHCGRWHVGSHIATMPDRRRELIEQGKKREEGRSE